MFLDVPRRENLLSILRVFLTNLEEYSNLHLEGGLHATNVVLIPAKPVQVEYEQGSISSVLWVMLVLGVVIAALLVVLGVVWRKARQ